MKKLFVVAALIVGFSAPAVMAKNGNGPPSDLEKAERRCGNNGEGNDAEVLKYVYGYGLICIKNKDFGGEYFEPDEDHPRDVDPN